MKILLNGKLIDPDILTVDNYTELTGRYFKPLERQRRKIEAGEMTTEQALAEFLAKTKSDQTDHHPICVYWDIGSCNCGAINK